ncbi:MAG TPA: hypothetical protein VNT28_04445, partial [Candidatus Limnocylindrales bacterium]|nr:hypothetical protein [Candidatus Limnocylindrales bacterium]
MLVRVAGRLLIVFTMTLLVFSVPVARPAATVAASAPSVPQGLTATAHDNFVIKLSWKPSVGASGTMRYRVFRNGTAIGTKQAATTFTDKRSKANTFKYQVRAIDSAGRRSALSPAVTISSVKSTSLSGSAPATRRPSVPQGLTGQAESNFVVKLSWGTSVSSASGTMRYRVFRNGVAIGRLQTATTYSDQRARARTFRYQVRAVDSAGRRSALSPAITVTTVRVASSPSPSVSPSADPSPSA